MAKSFRQAVLDAKAWFDENPTRLIKGYLAVNSEGKTCPTNDPDAQCFCAIGRVAKELDLNNETTQGAIKVLRAREDISLYVKYDLEEVVSQNDDVMLLDPAYCPRYNRGNSRGIRMLAERVK
jgi:hypothetical protein